MDDTSHLGRIPLRGQDRAPLTLVDLRERESERVCPLPGPMLHGSREQGQEVAA